MSDCPVRNFMTANMNGNSFPGYFVFKNGLRIPKIIVLRFSSTPLNTRIILCIAIYVSVIYQGESAVLSVLNSMRRINKLLDSVIPLNIQLLNINKLNF